MPGAAWIKKRKRRLAGGGEQDTSGDGLLNGLTAHWKLDASGLLVDSRGSHTLTNVGGVATAAGKFGEAADFDADTAKALKITDATGLRGGDISLCIAAWVYPRDLDPTNMAVARQRGDEYWLALAGGGVGDFYILGNGDYPEVNTANTAGLNAWHLLIGWADKDARTVNVQLDNGTVASTDAPGPWEIAAGDLIIGAINFAVGCDGKLDAVSIWRGTIPTENQRTALWNGGDGLAFADYASASP